MDQIRKWCANHHPEAIVGHPTLKRHLQDSLKSLGSETRFPDYCGLGISPQELLYQTQYGITEPCFQVNRAATKMLAGLIYRHETGIPEHSVLIEMPGAHWNWKKHGREGALR